MQYICGIFGPPCKIDSDRDWGVFKRKHVTPPSPPPQKSLICPSHPPLVRYGRSWDVFGIPWDVFETPKTFWDIQRRFWDHLPHFRAIAEPIYLPCERDRDRERDHWYNNFIFRDTHCENCVQRLQDEKVFCTSCSLVSTLYSVLDKLNIYDFIHLNIVNSVFLEIFMIIAGVRSYYTYCMSN